MKTGTKNDKIKRIAFMGVFFAVAIVLSIVENMIPPLPFLPPGVKLGLSNIVTMYCLFFVGRGSAFGIAMLKSCFVMLTRGFTAGLLSFSGGVLAVLVMMVLMILFKNKCSYLILSIAGGISHNLAQIAVASVILNTSLILYYFPILLISGLFAGILTATLLKIVMPAFDKLNLKL